MPREPNGRLRRLVDELNRRKVIQAAGAYLVVAFVILQVVDAAFDLIFANPETAGRVVLVALVIGFPVALGIAWVFQVSAPRFTREIARPDEDVAVDSAPEPLRRDSIAVIPFENLSDDPSNAYFSDGITEDIITSIARIKGLRVLSRASVARFRDAGRSVQEIAAGLSTATVVLGSVRRAGSRVRIVAQVVDATSDSHLWSETYDRELQDIFHVQSEVAQHIADAVARELPAADRERIASRGTASPEAYDLYLRGRYLWNQRTESTVTQGVRYFQNSLEHDPAFALAHAAMAEAHTAMLLYGVGSPRELVSAAKASADAALSVDPALGDALAVKACLEGIFDWKWSRAEQMFLEAIDLAPSYPTAHQWYALNLLAPLGRFSDATAQLAIAGDLDPGSAAISASHGLVAFYERRYQEATDILEEVVRVHPRFGLAECFLGQCYEQSGEVERAIAAHSRAVPLSEESSETLAALAHATARGGQKGQAEAILGRLRRRMGRRYVSRALLAQVLIGLERHDEAIAELQSSVQQRATDLVWIGVRPVYDPIRGDDRFKSIVSEVGVG
jgi:TolB-like protein/Tfp pilus assembly protein PilF